LPLFAYNSAQFITRIIKLYTKETIEAATRLSHRYYKSEVKVAIKDGHELSVVQYLVEERHAVLQEKSAWQDWNAVDVALECGRADVLAWLVDVKKLPNDGDDFFRRSALQKAHYDVLLWLMQRPERTATWEQIIDQFIQGYFAENFFAFFKACAPHIIRAANAEKFLLRGQQTILFSATRELKQSYQAFLKSLEQYLEEGDEAIAQLIANNSGLTFHEDANNKNSYKEEVVAEAEALFAQHEKSAVVFAIRNKVSVPVIQYLVVLMHCPLLGENVDSVSAAIDASRGDVLYWLVGIGFDKDVISTQAACRLRLQDILEQEFTCLAELLRLTDKFTELLAILQYSIHSNHAHKDRAAIVVAEMLLLKEVELKEPGSPLLAMWPESHLLHRAMQGYYLVREVKHPTAASLRSAFENILSDNLHCAPGSYLNPISSWNPERAQLFISYALFKEHPDDLEMRAILQRGIAQNAVPAIEALPQLKRAAEPDESSEVRKSKRVRKPVARLYSDGFSPAFFASKTTSAAASSASSLQKQPGKKP
jgi:hypothetical protein